MGINVIVNHNITENIMAKQRRINLKGKGGGFMRENIIRVHRPQLTPEERERRMKLIHDAAVQLLIATAEAKRKEHTK